MKTKIKIILLLCFLILLSLAPFYLHNSFLGDLGDPIGQTIPNKFLLIEYIKNCILPLWNSFSFLGFPFLGDIQTGVMYLPDIAIFSIFSPLQAHNISVLFHLCFAGIGFFFLVRNISKSNIIAFALSISIVLSGPLLCRIVYLNFLETLSFLPWILLVIRRNKKTIPLLGILIALMIFAGHPIASFYNFIIIFIYSLINHLKNWKKIFLGIFIGILIASIQIIPFITLQTNSVRESLTYEQFIQGSINFKDFFSFISPLKKDIPYYFDVCLHFGTICFLLLILSLPFIFKFQKNYKKIFISGFFLCLIGLLLSLGGTIPFMAKLLYNIPIFNMVRVPGRYIFIFHIGALLMIGSFLTYILNKNKKLTVIISLLIVFNSMLIPQIFLKKIYSIEDAEMQYIPEIKSIIEKEDNTKFSLTSVPNYFLSSSIFLFPNRHILNLMPNIIGYNPLILKKFYGVFPVEPVGAFSDANYFINLYNKFNLVGIKYYIFPTNDYLSTYKLENKKYIINFLKTKAWKIIGGNEYFNIWKNTNKKPFAYFSKKTNIANISSFQPGKIEIQTDIKSDDTLIINQVFYPGWKAFILPQRIEIEAKPFNELLQSYSIPKNTKSIIVKYKPKDVYYGLILTTFGIIFLTISFFKKKEIKIKKQPK